MSLYSPGCPDMDKEMIPKFTSKDEEVDYWKSQALKYKKRYVVDDEGVISGCPWGLKKRKLRQFSEVVNAVACFNMYICFLIFDFFSCRLCRFTTLISGNI